MVRNIELEIELNRIRMDGMEPSDLANELLKIDEVGIVRYSPNKDNQRRGTLSLKATSDYDSQKTTRTILGAGYSIISVSPNLPPRLGAPLYKEQLRISAADIKPSRLSKVRYRLKQKLEEFARQKGFEQSLEEFKKRQGEQK